MNSNILFLIGLDPAGPYFQYTDNVVQLDPTEANFVDVIHTDSKNIMVLGYGMIQPVGHVDFYPNSGVNQPGCDKNPITTLLSNLNVYNSLLHIVACNHLRAIDYFTESINSVCPFQGYNCDNYEDFKQGICMPCSEDGCGYMGFHADRVKPPAGTTNVKYFLDTGDSKPFCRYHYQIEVSFSNVSHATTERGIVSVSLMGSNGQLEETALSTVNMEINPGKTHGMVVTSTNDIGLISSATVSWHQTFSINDFMSWQSLLGTKSPSVYISRQEIVNGKTNRR
ncbi:hypothetical protein CHS0354_011085 [Potamilus streckersoni]|uniref:PLAT domain-containing protein n=1 Tax=Potamilus streckersoni TaxID=2493646 RepID=A0AAE0TL14_9BIVA|nr:hypothetical protein CHS0354_011085 [Potamilus streckersoni]